MKEIGIQLQLLFLLLSDASQSLSSLHVFLLGVAYTLQLFGMNKEEIFSFIILEEMF